MGQRPGLDRLARSRPLPCVAPLLGRARVVVPAALVLTLSGALWPGVTPALPFLFSSASTTLATIMPAPASRARQAMIVTVATRPARQSSTRRPRGSCAWSAWPSASGKAGGERRGPWTTSAHHAPAGGAVRRGPPTTERSSRRASPELFPQRNVGETACPLLPQRRWRCSRRWPCWRRERPLMPHDGSSASPRWCSRCWR